MLDGQDLTLELLVLIVGDASSDHRPGNTASPTEGRLRCNEDVWDVLRLTSASWR